MNIVAQNHADSLGGRPGRSLPHSQDALIASAIGDSLRQRYAGAGETVPEAILALARAIRLPRERVAPAA